MPETMDQATAESLAQSGPYEEVPGNLTAAVTNGTLVETRGNEMVHRILTPYFCLKQDQDFPTVDPMNICLTYGQAIDTIPIPSARYVKDDHISLIREVAAGGTALLKNERSLLPIQNITNVVVFGNAAPDTADGL
ncbi:putative Fibronectin type III-like domain-containing protein [Seiridium unicorne]|uniref:beta-glucosidase n=1 Tax=Seiridium unicorne TaxID=138068 RepID=A0ABR2UXN3_9PEZI